MTPKELYQKIDSLQKQLQNLQPMKREDEERLWKKLRLDWNYNSNHMEGNTLTYGHTELLLIFDKVTGDYSGREIEEMKAHDVAIKMVVELAEDKERDLTESFIRQLNEIILVRPFWKEAITTDGQPTRKEVTPGEYKKFPNSVRLENGEIFHYASPEETPALMNELMQFYKANSVSTEVHPLWLSAMLHYKFVRIHPFDDGNGRVARLLMNYVLLKYNLPPCIIKNSDKKNYITALNKADAGDMESFVIYIGEQLLWSFQLSIKASKGEAIDEPEDIDKRISILQKELEAVNPENEIRNQFNSDVFFEIFDTWFTSLLKEVIPAVQKFNSFFIGTNHRVSIINGIGSVFFINEDAESILNKLKEECLNNKNKIQYYDTKIHFKTFYGTFKKGGLKTFGCNYGFDIEFSLVSYKIILDKFVPDSNTDEKELFIERLLHKPVTNDEISEITRRLSKAILDHIEHTTKKHGIR